jgi:hypothetical protein
MGLVTCGRSVHPSVTAAEVSAALPFVIPSVAEGPAVSLPALTQTQKPSFVAFPTTHRI